MNRKAIVFTLGCRLNSADSALLVSRLTEAGYEVSESAENVALIIVNSCTVTAEAARKSRQMVRKFRSMHPEAVIVVTGCSAELDREAFLADSAADVVLTNPEKRSLPELVGEFLAGHAGLGGALKSMQQPVTPFRENAFGSFPFRSRAFLKIQEGCGNFCSYCIVPYARGPERSRAFDEVLADCRKAVEAGFPELVLTGVNTCAYSDSGRDLGALVHEIARIDGEFRIRLSSTEPAPGNRSLLDVMSSEPKVCRFLHLEYADFVRAARERIPGIHLGSDLIVGFPGETEEDFAESCRFVESMEFANLHIFTYSPRAGTKAAAMQGQIPEDVQKARIMRLVEAVNAQTREKSAKYVGKRTEILCEDYDPKRGAWLGRDEYGRMGYFADKRSRIGEFVTLKVTEANGISLYGTAED